MTRILRGTQGQALNPVLKQTGQLHLLFGLLFAGSYLFSTGLCKYRTGSRRAAMTPGRVAVTAEGGTWTFAELEHRSRQTALRLSSLGVQPEARVALLMTNDLPFVSTLHGITRLGAIAVPLNVRLAPAELIWQLRHSQATLLVCNEAMVEKAQAVADEAEVPLVLASAQDGAPRSDVPTLEAVDEAQISLSDVIDLDRVHTILYTSGTTGTPKGAMLTFGNHWWSAVASVLNLGIQPSDQWLACLPLFRAGGLSILMRSVIYGMPVLLHDGFDPERVNAAIDEEGVTMFSAVSNMLARMLNTHGERPVSANATLRAIRRWPGSAPTFQSGLRCPGDSDLPA